MGGAISIYKSTTGREGQIDGDSRRGKCCSSSSESKMASADELYQILASFSEPAYTYIIRLPLIDWKNKEYALQQAFKGGLWGNILDDEQIYNQTAKNFSVCQLYSMHYHSALCAIAHHALYDLFKEKQMTKRPKFDSFIQVEGTDKLHLHIVIAGQGLNKHNAKGWGPKIAIRFFTSLLIRLKDNLCGNHNKLEWLWVTNPIFYAAKDAEQGNDKNVSILQYKARNGDMYACRVDPSTFITNYFLPKNLWLNRFGDPGKFTPDTSYFVAAEKTYCYSSLCGKEISPEIRGDLHRKASEVFTGNQGEPVFGGDPYGDLPNVGNPGWTKSVQPAGRMTKREGLVLACMRRAVDDNLLTYEQMVNACPELVVMMESQPGGARLLQQTLQMAHVKIVQTYTAIEYIRKLYPDEEVEPENKVFHLLNTQGYNAWQVGHWVCTVLNKEAGKQNTISFFGPASTGKTNLAKAIVNTVKLYGCVNHQNKNFVFNDCAAKLVVWWEECVMNSEWVEQAKCCLGGTEFRIDRKHQDSQLLPKTPVIISTNNNIYTVTGGNVTYGVHERPLRDRVVQFNFMKCLSSTFGEISVSDCAAWLIDCSNRFECTLQGFYREWGVDVVPNSFPLQSLCPSHSQDFTLHEHGLCLQCGGYLPLRKDEEAAGATPWNTPTYNPEDVLVPGEQMLSTPVKQCLLDFDTTLLNTPSSISFTATPSPPVLTPQEVDCLSPPKKRLRTGTVLDNINDHDYTPYVQESPEWEMQSQGSGSEQEPQPGPSGITPTQWGDIIGIIQGDLEAGQQPTTLYCFETIQDNETEMG